MQTEAAEAATTPAPGNGGGPAAGIDLDWLAEQDSVSPLSGMRPLRALHGELSDLRRDLRRERQPARPDLLDARRRRRPAGDGTGRPRAPRALPRLPGLRVGLPVGRPVRQDDRAVQDRAPEARRPAGEKTSLLQRLILHHLFPVLRPGASWRWRRPGCCSGSGVLDWAERIGLTRLLPPTLRRMQAMLPKLARSRGRLPEVLPPIGPKRARVALFLGCVADAMFPETNAATARVLQQNGCEVVIPRGQVCCGAIHYHSGVEEPALDAGPAEHGGVRCRPRSTRSSSTPPAAARCSRTTPTSSPRPSTTTRRGSSPRSRTSPSSWWPWGRSRPAHPFRSR